MGISRPLKCMHIDEHKCRSTEHGCMGFDGYMWDPEYSDSDLRAVEPSGESRDELCPCQQTQLKLLSQADGWYTCDQCPSDANDNKHGTP